MSQPRVDPFAPPEPKRYTAGAREFLAFWQETKFYIEHHHQRKPVPTAEAALAAHNTQLIRFVVSHLDGAAADWVRNWQSAGNPLPTELEGATGLWGLLATFCELELRAQEAANALKMGKQAGRTIRAFYDDFQGKLALAAHHSAKYTDGEYQL